MITGKDTVYFPHDSNAKDDPKVMLMMSQLGLEAYGIYWILVEFLRDQPSYQAPTVLLDALSRRYGSSREKFEAVVTKFNLFEYNDLTFWSTSLQRRMEHFDIKKKYMQDLANKRWEKYRNNAPVLPMQCAGNAQAMQIEENRREEKRSEKKRKEKSMDDFSFHFPDENFNNSISKKWVEWKLFRRQIKKPYRTLNGEKTAFKKLKDLSGSDADTATAIIQQSIDNEWMGFFPLKQPVKSAAAPGEDPVDRLIREADEYRKKQKNGI